MTTVMATKKNKNHKNVLKQQKNLAQNVFTLLVRQRT